MLKIPKRYKNCPTDISPDIDVSLFRDTNILQNKVLKITHLGPPRLK